TGYTPLLLQSHQESPQLDAGHRSQVDHADLHPPIWNPPFLEAEIRVKHTFLPPYHSGRLDRHKHRELRARAALQYHHIYDTPDPNSANSIGLMHLCSTHCFASRPFPTSATVHPPQALHGSPPLGSSA
ncbi:unnamed protein product, partial [Sphacelaria rigidula]